MTKSLYRAMEKLCRDGERPPMLSTLVPDALPKIIEWLKGRTDDPYEWIAENASQAIDAATDAALGGEPRSGEVWMSIANDCPLQCSGLPYPREAGHSFMIREHGKDCWRLENSNPLTLKGTVTVTTKNLKKYFRRTDKAE